MRIVSIFIVIVFICVSCKKDIIEADMQMYDISPSLTDVYFLKGLKEKINVKGDTIAYKELRSIYLKNQGYSYLLQDAMIMAYTYNYGEGYLDAYYILSDVKVDSKNKAKNELANYYLFKASELGANGVNSAINDRFGKGFIVPDSKKYFDKVIKSESNGVNQEK